MALSLYAAWLVLTLYPIVGWKEGVRYSNRYSKEKERELTVAIGGRERGRERELEFPIVTIIGELEEVGGMVREREFELCM